MGDAQEAQAAGVLKSMKLASETVRSAIATAIPVASNQVLTVSLPGTVIDWKEYYYNADKYIKPPLDIQVKEARLVDGMIPLSKFTAGKTGKSVARSYLATLDLLIPVEASVSGVIGNEAGEVADERLRTIRDRYKLSMSYLTSPDDTPTGAGRTKVDTYVQKQSAWAEQVAAYSHAQSAALRELSGPGASPSQQKEAREKYMQWLQENARNFKNNIQTKYMDWVVHGYKFLVDFHFGVVDISSGMKRIENSKEAYRNLTIIASDGSSEYNGVVLTPSTWAKEVALKVLHWKANNHGPSIAEVRAELRRLQNLLASHETLKDAINKNQFHPVLEVNKEADQTNLKSAYLDVYSAMDVQNGGTKDNQKSGGDILDALVKAQKEHTETSLKRNNATIRDNTAESKSAALGWLDTRIEQLKTEIGELKTRLGMPSSAPEPGQLAGKLLDLPVVDGNGIQVSCKVSSKSSLSETKTSQSASAVAAKAGWGLWSASVGGGHSSSSADAMESMSNLDVEVNMSCMVVEIERPWLHAELFADAELDSGKFDISPGEDALKKHFEEGTNPKGEYQQFSSYPTAFVLAADIELSFSGDTTKLESAVSASSTEVNARAPRWNPQPTDAGKSSLGMVAALVPAADRLF
ncbi:hypothetical protein CSIM01_07318 [Colletotrichum simmondsii]|uniref:Uncharacterized protein n=1 Tax=Colletotrichum simmondsii TaxID=703756 RepID=A0A135TPD4_9PEZI|nr:hypothetical protein CSIM01_07318 [Colletotrichum simmondsii]